MITHMHAFMMGRFRQAKYYGPMMDTGAQDAKAMLVVAMPCLR